MDTSSNTVCFALEDIGREDEVRGPGHSCLKRGNGYDYVFFDWKGTLAKKSGLNTRQRTEIRLRHFYNALKDLVGGPRETSVSIRSGDLSDSEDDYIANGNKAELEPKPVAGEGVKLPTFEELEALFERLMKEHKGEDGTKTFSWHSFLHALLRELGLAQLNAHEKHLLVTAFQGSGSVDSGLHPGAEEIVRWLREDAGLRLGLIRNSKLNEQAMRNRIAKAGIDPDHFESVVMGGEVGFAKPDAEVFITAAKTANIESVHSTDPKRILYIGNEVIADVHGANGVGWTSVLVTHTEPSSGGLADFEIDHLLQLKDIVLRSRDDTEERLY